MSRVFGTAIKNDRERLGISQSLLARVLRVSQQIMSRWESGDAIPRGTKLEALLETLGSTSETRRLVDQITEIDPSFFESANHLAAFVADSLPDRPLPLTPSQINRLAEKGLTAYARRAPEQAPPVKLIPPPEPPLRRAPPSPEHEAREINDDLRLQFARAADQLVRATNLLGKVAAMMAETGSILAGVGKRIEELEQKQTKPAEDPKED
jgi:transcriptional regulator with XRE-family HTH domain